MEKNFLQDITERCHQFIKELNDSFPSNFKSPFVQKLYSKFSFECYSCPFADKNQIKSFLQKYLDEFQFIVFEKSEQKITIPFSQAFTINQDSNIIDIVICVENKCLIIENIQSEIFDQVFSEVKASKIDVNPKSCEDKKIIEEIQNFKGKINYFVKKSDFLLSTINSIVGYLIRRYYYPTNFFKDPTFFNYNEIAKNSEEYSISKKLYDIIQTKEKKELKIKVKLFQSEMLQNIFYSKNNFNIEKRIYKFNSNEFQYLRNLYSKGGTQIDLVIHTKSLYIFAFKKMNPNDCRHEIDFNENYSHRCFRRFYGFVKERDYIGFIYEFMSNGSIVDYFKSNGNQTDELFSLTTLIRIIEGTKFLHSQHMVHRDIKPSNILVDHDLISYISDFETIRNLNDESNKVFTYDFSASLYSSPEQNHSESISYPTDIYSLGITIYYLFQKKNMFSQSCHHDYIYDQIKKGKIPEITNVTSNIQFLYSSCVKYDPKERMLMNDIESIIDKEIKSFHYLEKFAKEEKISLKMTELIQFFLESIIFQSKDYDSFNEFMKCILNFDIFLLFTNYFDKSNILHALGNIYLNGVCVPEDFKIAKDYFEQSAQLNNSFAFLSIGDLYMDGIGVDKDINMAIKFYELAVSMQNPYGNLCIGYLYYIQRNYSLAIQYYEAGASLNIVQYLLSLGSLYSDGKEIPKDLEKTLNYYNRAAELNNPEAYHMLGNIYINELHDVSKAIMFYEKAAELYYIDSIIALAFLYNNGEFLPINYIKAKYYFEKAMKLNNADAIYCLGVYYNCGYGVKQDYHKAKEYFELAIKLNDQAKGIEYFEKTIKLNNDPNTLYSLGKAYFLGKGVEKDIERAIQFYEKSASYNNSNSLMELSELYYKGECVPQNLLKAKNYLDLLAQQNNSFAFLYLGYMHFFGIGADKNYQIAGGYFEKASEQKNAEAFLNLSVLYFDGVDFEQNYSKAIECYEKAVEINKNIEILNLDRIYLDFQENNDDLSKSIVFINIGNLYNDGIFVQKNYFKSIEFNLKAANLKNPEAMKNLGVFYKFGYGFNIDYHKAKEYFELAAEQNNPEAICYLGCLYYDGQGVEQDFKKGIKLFEKAAALNNTPSMINIGLSYYKGLGVPQNYEIAIKYYEKAADQGNSSALLFLGNLFSSGQIVQIDINKAIDFFKKAANLNNFYAMYNLGNLYLYGISIPKDHKKAIEYYEKAAKLNHLDSLVTLANLYINGIIVQQNYLKAIEYLEIAASFDYPAALHYLGIVYINGYGVEKNYNLGIDYFERAAKQDFSDSINYLGLLYIEGIGVEQNYSMAIVYFEKAKNMNNPLACINIGGLYLDGLGVPKNINKAIENFEAASRLKNSMACLILGHIYYKGQGLHKNKEKGIQYYKQAAELNNSSAMMILGNFYINGVNVKKDYNKGIEYYEKAAYLNDPEAKIFLLKQFQINHKLIIQNPERFLNLISSSTEPNDIENKLKVQLLIDLGDKYLNGIGFEKNYSKAINCYEKAAEFNDSDAFYKLGNIYLYGKGVSRNIEKANEYYEKSISLNNSKCLLHLAKIYFYGEIVPKDKEKAIKYFERSAEQNNSTAILFLANFYLFSKNDNNLAKAKEYFELYSKTMNIIFNKKLDYIKNNFSLNLCDRINWINEITSSLAYNCLGLIFLIESIENHESFESIVNQNTSIIYLTIGNLYLFGQCIDKKALFNQNKIKNAVDFFDANDSFNTKYSFYDQKNVDLITQIIFEEINFKGKEIGQNYFKAKKYYEKAAELNDPIALNNLGCLYYYGFGVGENYKKSINFFERAAKLNNLTAYNNLADIFMRRQGVEHNYSKAIEYYEISAKQNNLNAIKELGYIYIF